jgi:hypothetical protein
MEIIGNYLVSVGKNQANRPYWPGSLQPVYDLMPKPYYTDKREREWIYIIHVCTVCTVLNCHRKVLRCEDSVSYVIVRGGQGNFFKVRKS